MTEGEEHLPTIKQELMKMVNVEGSVTYDTKPSITTEMDSSVPKKTRVSGMCDFLSKYNIIKTFFSIHVHLLKI